MKIRIAESSDASTVDEFVNRMEMSSLYHDYRWISVIAQCFGHQCYYLVCEESNGMISGTLPMVHLNSRLFGNFLVSMPFFNYGGVCAESEASRSLLIEEAVRIANDVGASHIELRQESPLQNGFPSRTSKVSMRLDLPSSPEELLRSFPSKLRSQVRRPQKEGMTTRIGRFEELDGFHHVFSVNMRKLGTPALPKGFFREILVQFPDESWICSVYLDRTPVASGFLVAFKNRLEIPWASTLSDFNRYSPNMLLYWCCLEFACRSGFKVFDFGRSTAGEKTYKFKEQWGARPVQLHWHYWIKGGEGIPDLTPGNPKYRLAIALWKRLPLYVTKIIGPQVIRNIP